MEYPSEHYRENQQEYRRGFVTTVVLIIIALIGVKYAFHFDIVEYIKSPGPQKIIQTTWTDIKNLYNWIDSFVSKTKK